MPESHFFSNIMEAARGQDRHDRSQVQPAGVKVGLLAPVRPGLSDTAIFLGITKILMDEGL